MLVFLDTEFTAFVRPDLISIGLVAEDGREFYAERTDYYTTQCSDFVRETVLPLLGRVPGAACTRTELTDRVRDWFGQLPEPATVVFDSEKDWLLLAVAMLGRPHSTPPGNFAKQMYLDSYAITHPAFETALNAVYTPEWPAHHALADARALMAGYRAWCTHRGNPELPPPLIHEIVQSIEDVKAGQLAPYKSGKSEPC
ncbi:3'-5' exoribonuclease [Polaromonas sp. UBA4122]|uniref:3'-5' exoribonuclease n=1 Tax=Polaromonas sp. UBA4122 TaxID=1947074 RepID=UPI0025FD51A6|nr:3'-5' exoribonuclease [Polaromonas sp. UBA4122]